MSKVDIPFNRPHMTGRELHYISQAHLAGRLSGDGAFTNRCHNWLCENTDAPAALLTNSCTAALEMAAILADIKPGDEVILPSYTFVSTANAFVLRGAVPVLLDIREDTLNLDERLIEAAITPRTKAISPVHYAGVGCEMDFICELAKDRDLLVIEDAAQGIMAKYRGKPLGSLGDLGAYSFHETKNVISGEGGALLVNDESLIHQAEIIREKGTDRARFFRGQVDKYTWQSIGSSYLPGELVAAFLYAQLEAAEDITAKRLQIWNRYHEALFGLEREGLVRRPIIPPYCSHNAHMYYVVLNERYDRERVISQLADRGVHAVFHYVPLHMSPAGEKYCRVGSSMHNSEDLSSRLMRLPMWVDLPESDVDRVVDALTQVLRA